MNNRSKVNLKEIYPIIYYILFLALMIGVLMSKKNFHVDEVYSYGLANHMGGLEISFEDGYMYEPATLPYIDYVAVNKGEQFQYANVWANQVRDTHPPLYYAILHTICSLFPGTFSIWYAGAINIVFGLMTLYVIRKLFRKIVVSEKMCSALTLGFLFCPGILSAVSFLRMYVMAMFLAALLTYVFVCAVVDEKQAYFAWKIFFIAWAGALTHYYFVVFAVFLCVVYGLYLLMNKKWKSFGSLCASMGFAAAASLCVFPQMLKHVLLDFRGTEAIDNFKKTSFSGYAERIKEFCEIVDGELFGGVFFWLLLTIIVFAVVWKGDRGKKGKGEQEKRERGLFVVLIPTGAYFLLIGKIAAYLSDRYMFPIYGLLFVSIWSVIAIFLRRLLNSKTAVGVIWIALAFVTISCWRTGEWKYLFHATENFLTEAERYEEVDCLYIYDAKWKTQPSFYEVKEYKSATFLKNDELELLKLAECAEKEELMVIIIGDRETILEKILESCSQFKNVEEIGEYSYGKTYYLCGKD